MARLGGMEEDCTGIQGPQCDVVTEKTEEEEMMMMMMIR